MKSLSRLFFRVAFPFLFPVLLSGDWKVTYSFDNGLDARTSHDFITATKITGGADVRLPRGTSAVSRSGRSVILNNAGFHHLSKAGAIKNERYLMFSLEIDEGHTVGFDRFAFSTLRQPGDGGGAPDSFALYSKFNDDIVLLGTGEIPLSEGDEDQTFAHHVMHFTSVPEMGRLSGRIDFLFYFWASQGNLTPGVRTFRLDELTLSGSVAAGRRSDE